MIVIPCRRGGVVGITPQMLNRIVGPEERFLSLSVFDAVEHMSVVSASASESFTQFCALDGYSLMLTVRSPFFGNHASAPSAEQGVSGDHENGRVSVSPSKLADLIRVLKPSHAVSLYDAPALDEPASKKRRTAQERTRRWLTDASGCRVGVTWIVPASAASNIPCELHTGGVYLDALCQNETLGQRLAAVQEAVSVVHGTASSKTTMVVSHATTVADVLLLASCGCTHIETALPWLLADRGLALNLHFADEQEEDEKRTTPALLTESSILDLNDPQYALCMAPLASKTACRCYTCERHTRAYLHHLLTVQEMNSGILLSVHNLTQLVDMLRRLRSIKEERTRNTWTQKMLKQFALLPS